MEYSARCHWTIPQGSTPEENIEFSDYFRFLLLQYYEANVLTVIKNWVDEGGAGAICSEVNVLG